MRPELPRPIPERIMRLPIDRGYPVPWFVVWVDEFNNPAPKGEGKPDFRIIFPGAVAEAIRFNKCWICGDTLGAHKSFVLGPMCGINRTSAEPPSHLECADWSARACPFLARPHARRREGGITPEHKEVPGTMLERNLGVALVWTTKSFKTRPVEHGVLIDIGEPEHCRWYAEGRPASRAEVLESIEGGLPVLQKAAADESKHAERQLEKCVERAMTLIPAG